MDGLVIRRNIRNDVEHRAERLGDSLRSDHVNGRLINVVANAAADAAATTTTTTLSTTALVSQPGGDRSDIGHLDVGLTAAQRGDFRC